MVEVRVEDKPSFIIAGRKTWISGEGNEQFGVLWSESHENGLIETLRDLSNNRPGEITNSYVFGVSEVDENPDNRTFDFYIATEVADMSRVGDLDHRTVPACTWAIFSNKGELPMSLVDAEMYAFLEWLPQSGYQHAHAPEIEVYPAYDSQAVEFWLPIIKSV